MSRPFHYEIERAEQQLEDIKAAYLRRFGWAYTCKVACGIWLWCRDFADVDARRAAYYAGYHPEASKPIRYGIITAPMDVAVSITAHVLDEQAELPETETP